MFAIEVQVEFLASHQLRLPGGGVEPLHEHDWRVQVRVESSSLDALETVMDFHVLEASLMAIVTPWRGRRLNDIPPFDLKVNPSAERVAEHVALRLAPAIPPPARLAYVRVTEAPHCHAVYIP